MQTINGYGKLSRTRYAELAIMKTGNVWRIADITDGEPHAVGSQYRTKFEAFADLDRYAREYGVTPIAAS